MNVKVNWKIEAVSIKTQIDSQRKYASIQNEYLHEFISWGEDKSTIKIPDIKAFEQNVLAQYFRHHNFESFARQMNLYEFKKKRSCPIQIFTNK